MMRKERKSGKISIYQVLPRLFGNTNSTRKPNGTLEENGSGKLDNFTREVLADIKALGTTHIWYTGVIEHATQSSFEGIPAGHPDTIKGIAGSPYAIKDYYDIAPALANKVEQRWREFEQLIIRTHNAGLGVIIDFVPNHVAREYHSSARPPHVQDLGATDNTPQAFHPNNNFYYLPGETLELSFGSYYGTETAYQEYPARATGNNQFTAHPSLNDWYETVKLNYGVDYLNGATEHFTPIPNTWQKMLDILTYWATCGVDGFRCDMAEMVPPAFWKWAISNLKRSYPHLIVIGEVYQPQLYSTYIEAGFDFLYDKVGLYDHLIAVLKGQQTAQSISWATAALPSSVRNHMLHFMENHDEQRLASDFIASDAQKAFPAMAVSALISSTPIMTYFGQELGERGMDAEGFSGLDGRTTIFDYWHIESIERWLARKSTPQEADLRKRYQQLLNAAIKLRSISEGNFFDLVYANQHLPLHLYSFLRATEGEVSLVVTNFSATSEVVQIHIPNHALEVLHIPSGIVWQVQEHFTGKLSVASLYGECPIKVEVPPYGVALYTFARVVE